MIERLLELIRIKMMSPSQLADAIGVQRSGISHFVSGRNKPSLEFIIKILNFFPDISPDWLLFGKNRVFREGFENMAPLSSPPSEAANEIISENSFPEQAQASLLNELFVKTENPIESKSFRKEQGIKYQTAEIKQRSVSESGSPKKEKEKVSGGKSISGGKSMDVRERKPERIVIFYNDHTFSEYLSE
jgi:transcriptional regulator with XRE-family HTH domain